MTFMVFMSRADPIWLLSGKALVGKSTERRGTWDRELFGFY